MMLGQLREANVRTKAYAQGRGSTRRLAGRPRTRVDSRLASGSRRRERFRCGYVTMEVTKEGRSEWFECELGRRRRLEECRDRSPLSDDTKLHTFRSQQ
jgi:hypothetical protein